MEVAEGGGRPLLEFTSLERTEGLSEYADKCQTTRRTVGHRTEGKVGIGCGETTLPCGAPVEGTRDSKKDRGPAAARRWDDVGRL